jgi:peptidoglycan/xylan/chitin deacetylase (PgdA/CDA1 family)
MEHPVRLPRHHGALLLAAALVGVIATSCFAPAAEAEHLSYGCRDGHRVALTFDDGPNPPYTEEILTILVAHRVTATFFVEGQAVETHHELVTRELEDGMAVGLHSYGHSQDLPLMTRAEFGRDLQRAEKALAAPLGYTPGLYRAPYGHMSRNMLVELRARGYISIGWEVDSTDWSSASADQVVSSVLDQVQPGSIILMHDGGVGGGNPDRSNTVASLPRIIDGLRSRGYSFATVPELTGAPGEHGEARRPACSAN